MCIFKKTKVRNTVLTPKFVIAVNCTEKNGGTKSQITHLESGVYIPSDQGMPDSLEGALECLHRTKALEGSREGKGQVACTYSIVYITSQQGRVSKVRRQQSFVRWYIPFHSCIIFMYFVEQFH
jgi:hypothetical protein